ncbi:MAG TPA: SBBP repeat-containing protein [Candidatus Kapabacteria bacterium]|nr:SBBP repeat-containing protein [Candidatus Kapabacteria bacterium]
MKQKYILPSSIILILFAVLPVCAQQKAIGGARADHAAALRAATHDAGATFIENRGQWNPDARYLARWSGLNMWVTGNGLVYDFHRPDARGSGASAPPARGSAAGVAAPPEHGHVMRMRFVGAADAGVVGATQLPGVFNYFIGNDPARWAVGARSYASVELHDLYPGIGARVYVDPTEGMPRYDLLVAPGTDPSAIRIAFDGASRVRVDASGDLVVTTSLGDVHQKGLYAYQVDNGRRERVQCSFTTMHDGSIGFRTGSFDRSRALVIDPLVYSTYLCSDAYSRGFDIAVDGNDNAYVTGYTGATVFPTSLGAYQGGRSGASTDAFVTKLAPNGRTLVYSTYLGGTTDDAGTSIAVDAAGAIYVAGYTYSTDFPIKTAPQTTLGGVRDAFVTKLDPLGITPASQLVYSTYLGGGALDFATALAVHNGEAYVTGLTASNDFPTVTPFQAGASASGDIFITHLSAAGSTILGSTYLGGGKNEEACGIAVDQFGSAYVAGLTYSLDFPTHGVSTPYDATDNGNNEAFVVKLTANMNTLLYGTYLGGSGDDYAYGIAVDAAGDAFVTGRTKSSDFPVTPGAYGARYNGGGGDIFMSKLDPNGSTLLFSTYIGGNNDEWALDITLDGSTNAWIAGVTLSDNFPVTPNGIQPQRGGATYDAMILALDRTGSRLVYASYLGGTGADTARALAIGSDGSVFLTGSTFAANYPTSANAYLRTSNGGTFVTRVGVIKLLIPGGGEVFCAGEDAHISWQGDPANSYDLYFSGDSGKTFTPIAFSVTGNSYDWFAPPGLAPGVNYRIKITASNASESDMSTTFTIIGPPIVQSSPVSQTVAPGGSVTFSATASGTPQPLIQWQIKTGQVWNDIANETGTLLKLTNIPASRNGAQYRALFKNSCRVVSSDSATLTVPSVHLITPNGGEAFCVGDVDTIRWSTVANNGPVDLSYSTDNGLSWNTLVRGVTNPFYVWTIPASLSGGTCLVRVNLTTVATGDVSDSLFSINQIAHVTTQPTNTNGVVDGDATFTAKGSGIPAPQVRWQVDDGTGWNGVPSATGTTLHLTGLAKSQDGYRYRAIFTNLCGSDTTQPARLTVTFEPTSVDARGAAAVLLSLAAEPNPASGSVSILATLQRAAHVRIRLLDMRGNVMAQLADRAMEAGDQNIPFSTAGIPSGVYIVDLEAGGRHRSTKLTVSH